MFTSTNPEPIRPVPGQGVLAPRIVEAVAGVRAVRNVGSVEERGRNRRWPTIWIRYSFEDYLRGRVVEERAGEPEGSGAEEAPVEAETGATPEVPADPSVGRMVDVRA